jgi:hypothetical protein
MSSRVNFCANDLTDSMEAISFLEVQPQETQKLETSCWANLSLPNPSNPLQ